MKKQSHHVYSTFLDTPRRSKEKKWFYRPPLEKFAAKAKGRNNEIRFRHLISNQMETPLWILRVKDAGQKDDFHMGIDFFVYTSTGWKIPVQVKSSLSGLEEHRQYYGDETCIVVMKKYLSDDEMRKDIVFSISSFQEEMIRRGLDYKFRTAQG